MAGLPFDDMPVVDVPQRARSLEPFSPFDMTALIHEGFDTPVYKLRVSAADGEIVSVWINDEKESHRILNSPKWKKGPQTFEPFSSLVPLHLISLEDELHALMRSQAQSALAEAISQKRVPGMQIGGLLVQALKRALQSGEPSWMDIVSTAIFGAKWNAIDDYSATNKKADALAKVMHELHWRVADFTERAWRKNHRAEPAGSLLSVLDEFIEGEVAKSRQRVRESSENTCMLDNWTRPEEALSPEQIRNLCMTFLTMGHENVATGLAWCTVQLAENLPAQHAAQSSRQQLVHAFHEAIRLYPSVAVLTRWTEEDSVVCGYQVPKFTEVVVNTYLVHRNKTTWGENAAHFVPARCPVVSAEGPPDSFPFGVGKRACIGRPLSYLELECVLGQVLDHFTLVAVEATPNPGHFVPSRTRCKPNNFVSLRPGPHNIAFCLRREPNNAMAHL